MSEPPKGRIAIRLGSTSSAPTSDRPPRPAPPSSLGKRPRSRAALGADSDSDSDSDQDRRGRHEAITGFGADGAETRHGREQAPKKKKEYIIERQPNRDWRGEMRAQRADAREPEDGTAATAPADSGGNNQSWGLTVKGKTRSPPAERQDGPAETPSETPRQAPLPRSADDEALDALLGNRPKEARVITTEDDVYRRDAAGAGAASTLQDYEEMPIEEFGAALLRGMGWDGQHRGPKVKDARKRPNRLGLGAKELKGVEDLGGWNQNGAKKRSRPRLDEYNRQQSRRKEERGREDSYKRERDRDRERDRNGHKERHRDGDRDHHGDERHRGRHGDYNRDRRR
ncbi:pre-mRNA-splicing factor spp2 [Metarhizium album ARSEF 1941]|uniref:Pre-mRNA-splicing factor n=1 Tax=Metarhizium album (strain ARSEF 1941) TaxID=1081103 RepID=A0A0B2X303_METAS|nr:pre-mRNA-splicing factor spp2 [Metarhizium album ARSEF 1941]KHO00709.1 pre-mRNA-splicing factor spp2 [Metarhizium album ARSEF 1941]